MAQHDMHTKFHNNLSVAQIIGGGQTHMHIHKYDKINLQGKSSKKENFITIIVLSRKAGILNITVFILRLY
jgi:hypothetical protein